MTTLVITNEPLSPLIERAEKLCGAASEILIASAFVNQKLVDGLLIPAAERGARVQLLTGTYGRFNRESLFRALLRHVERGSLEVRIWDGDGSRDFHAKLFIWKLPRDRGEAWIGSANFTIGGLNNGGELMLAERASWNAAPLRRLRHAFFTTWGEARDIDRRFVDKYQEAAQTPPDGRLRPPRASTRLRVATGMLLTSVARHIDDDSPEARHIAEFILPRNNLPWCRLHGDSPRDANRGDLVCIIDRIDDQISIGEIKDTGTYKQATVLAYSTVVSDRVWNGQTRSLLHEAGLPLQGDSPRTRWLKPAVAKGVIEALRKAPRPR